MQNGYWEEANRKISSNTILVLLPSTFLAEPALPVEVLLLGDLPGAPPRAHRGPRPDRRVELLGAGRGGAHGDPRATRVRLGPRAESLLEPEQDL